MAELVEAPSSGGGGGNPVEVRVLFLAPFVLLRTSQKVYTAAEIQGIWPLDRPGTCHEHPDIPRTFAGLSWVSAKTTSRKGPHVSLTDNQLKALKPKAKPYKVAAERGLHIEVTPKGGKLWRYRYRVGKIEKKLSIGTYPDISLKQARHAALEARMAVAKGGDPALEKRKQKIRAEFIAGNT